MVPPPRFTRRLRDETHALIDRIRERRRLPIGIDSPDARVLEEFGPVRGRPKFNPPVDWSDDGVWRHLRARGTRRGII